MRRLSPAKETKALRELADDVGALMPTMTGHQLARRAISILCEELKINAADLVAIKEGKARIKYL
jgi:hypothetical protein